MAGSALIAGPAHAGIFDDDQARQAILDLRSKTDSLTSQLAAAQRTMLDQQGRIDQLNQQIATVRGQNEDLTNQVTTLQKQQKDYYTDLDTRLKKFEPQTQTVDGVQGSVQPGETEAFNAASQQFRSGDYKGAAASFRNFIAKYPQKCLISRPRSTGSAMRCTHCAITRVRRLFGKASVKNYPQHPRAPPKRCWRLPNNQFEQGQKAAARKTFEQIVAQYSGSDVAQSARREEVRADEVSRR